MALPARREHELVPSRPVPRPRLAPVPPRGERRFRRRGRSRVRRLPFLLFSALLVVGVLLILTTAQALVAQDAFRLSKLSATADRIRIENDVLRLQVAELSTPDRVAEAGRAAGLAPYRELVVLGEGDR
jgi:cell division protein FtsL